MVSSGEQFNHAMWWRALTKLATFTLTLPSLRALASSRRRRRRHRVGYRLDIITRTTTTTTTITPHRVVSLSLSLSLVVAANQLSNYVCIWHKHLSLSLHRLSHHFWPWCPPPFSPPTALTHSHTLTHSDYITERKWKKKKSVNHISRAWLYAFNPAAATL